MNDSVEFQDAEPNYSGRLSHVSSQPAMILSSRALLSRDKRLPFDTWNQSGLQENVFGNQFSTFDDAERTKTSRSSEDRQNHGTIPMPTFATRLLTTSSTTLVELPQNYMVGQQRRQISELQFGKFSYPQAFSRVKMRFKNQVIA